MNWAIYAFFGVITAVLLAALGITCCCCYRRRRKQRYQEKEGTPYKAVRAIGADSQFEVIVLDQNGEHKSKEEFKKKGSVENNRQKAYAVSKAKTPDKSHMREDEENKQ